MISKNSFLITIRKFLLLFLNQKKEITVHVKSTLILRTTTKPLNIYNIKLSHRNKLKYGSQNVTLSHAITIIIYISLIK